MILKKLFFIYFKDFSISILSRDFLSMNRNSFDSLSSDSSSSESPSSNRPPIRPLEFSSSWNSESSSSRNSSPYTRDKSSRMDNDGFTPVQKSNRRSKNVVIPAAVEKQLFLRKKYSYNISVVETENSKNIYNNSTLYVYTKQESKEEVEDALNKVILKAKKQPEIFGGDFECDFVVNLVCKYGGEKIGFAYVDLSNPALYYALIGYNIDGSERVELVDDDNWVSPPAESLPEITSKGENWDDEAEAEAEKFERQKLFICPKIKKDLAPLIRFDNSKNTYHDAEGILEDFAIDPLPAFIIPDEISDDSNGCTLYVSGVPDISNDTSSNISDFLYSIFARYARYNSAYECKDRYFPKIFVNRNSKNLLYAAVIYAHHYDTKFALLMTKKIVIKYQGKDVEMQVKAAIGRN